MSRKCVCGAVLEVLLAIVLVAFSANGRAAEAEKVTVTAEGTGTTKIAALKDAWTNGVRQAVGMYLASSSQAGSNGLNDSYTEQIAAFSRGQVNSFDLLSETENNGVWTVRIKAADSGWVHNLSIRKSKPPVLLALTL